MLVTITDLHSMPLEEIRRSQKELVVVNDDSLGFIKAATLTIKAIGVDEYDFGNGIEDVDVIQLNDGENDHSLHH